MKQEKTNFNFTTTHELRFIENIGLDKFGGAVMESRKALIVKYIKSAHKRLDWANIDKDIVLSTANKLLREVM